MKQTPSILRSRRSSRLWFVFAVCGVVLTAGSLSAQNAQILTIDQERLLVETRLGATVLQKLETRALALAAENKSIEDSLIAEELELTEKRASLPAEEFRALANAFDEKVQTLRAAQDEKERDLNRAQEEARNAIVRDSAAVISEIVRQRGALLVIDRRNVFLSAGSIDITDEAIRRINENDPVEE